MLLYLLYIHASLLYTPSLSRRLEDADALDLEGLTEVRLQQPPPVEAACLACRRQEIQPGRRRERQTRVQGDGRVQVVVLEEPDKAADQAREASHGQRKGEAEQEGGVGRHAGGGGERRDGRGLPVVGGGGHVGGGEEAGLGEDVGYPVMACSSAFDEVGGDGEDREGGAGSCKGERGGPNRIFWPSAALPGLARRRVTGKRDDWMGLKPEDDQPQWMYVSRRPC